MLVFTMNLLLISGVIMILAGSMEFEKGHNPEICERPSDNDEIPAVSFYQERNVYELQVVCGILFLSYLMTRVI
jgi:hypothetical protein